MALAQNVQPIQVPRSPQQRFLTIALVVAFHLGVIAVFVVALNPRLVGIASKGPIVVTIDQRKKPPTDSPRVSNPPLQNPTMIDVQPPDVHIDKTDPWGPVLVGPSRDNIDGAPSGVFVAAQGITSTHTTPDYPPMAIRLGQTGNVHLKLWINEAGAVVSATVERSSGYDDLDEAAVAWVKQHWRYTPATRDGKATTATTDAIVTFRLAGRS